MSGPDYSTHDPKGWCGDMRRGAAMGRPRIKDEPRNYAGRLFLRRVRLDSGGYDRNGTYFGGGRGTLPLYWCANEAGTVDFMLRAETRAEAIAAVHTSYPDAKVRR